MLATDLTQQQLDNFNVLERLGSALSLIGALFVILTFISSKAFGRAINRMIFFASLGNMFSNIATLISRAAIEQGMVGSAKSLCYTQAFFIQMFMPADAYWTFAMALNIYLAFYLRFDGKDLRRMEKWYWVGCYGVPFIIAFAFIFVTTEEKGPMYGDATLWCWIAPNWDVVRIVAFYAPVWATILLTIAIYARAGKDIYAKSKQVKNFSNHTYSVSGIEEPQVYVTKSVTTVRTNTMAAPTPVFKDGVKTEISGGSEFQRPSVASTATATAPRPRGNTSDHMVNYTTVSILLFVAMMFTWIPSSANRLYSVIYPGHVSIILEYLSALLLPLQGFWNFVIYTFTSRKACRYVFSQMKVSLGCVRSRKNRDTLPHVHIGGKPLYGDTESTVELQSHSSTGSVNSV